MQKRTGMFVSMLFLISCSVSHQWVGSDVAGNNNARFSHFSGNQKFHMRMDTGVDGFIRYHFQVQLGRLKVEIRTPHYVLFDQEVVKELTGTIPLKPNKDSVYTLVLVGSKAAGAYEVQYGRR